MPTSRSSSTTDGSSLPGARPQEGGRAVLEHVAMVVPDLEAARAFYTGLLGCERTSTHRLEDHTIAYLSSGTRVLVELIAYDEPAEPAEGRAGSPRDIALRHLAWRVDDVDAAAERARSLGGTVTSPPTAVPELGFRSVLIHDPWGIESEIIEPL